MSNTVISIRGLGKCYKLGATLGGQRYKALRDSIAGAFKAPFRLLTNNKSKSEDDPKNAQYIWALKDVSLDIRQGEVIGIIGRNGAGKSTLLKILSQITEPTEGEIRIQGRVACLLEVGTGFHSELTGRENIFMNGAILGMTHREIRKKLDEIIAFAEVEKFVDTPVKRYSTGMYLRLAFAVAAHLEPEILLVDEVLAVGDAAFQKKCIGKMDDVSREGRTVIIVSHNMMSILQLCPRSIWLDSGRVESEGQTNEIVSRYLRDNRIPLGEMKFGKPDNSEGASIIRASVMDKESKVRWDIPYSEPFLLSLDYMVERPVEGLRLGFKLRNETNLTIVHSATSDCASIDARIGEIGYHTLTVKFPGALFAPGRYYFELGLWSPRVGHHHHIQNALALEIIGADFMSLGDEVLRPALEWDFK